MAADTDDAVRAWLETHMGPVAAVRCQPRWRPVWFATVTTDQGDRDVVVRGDRVELVHKRNLRARAFLGPAGSAMTTRHRIQPFHA